MTQYSAFGTHGPQWSPPLKGGSTDTTLMYDSTVAPPQWSPPLKGGSTERGESDPRILLGPQWSPPLKGGSTERAGIGPPYPAWAAMEPAVERREHNRGLGPYALATFKPQWSPPLKGGST